MAPQSTVATATGSRRRVDRWFYINVALLMILLNVVAFGPSIIDPSRRNVPLPLTPLVTAHAIVAAAWLLLFLLQATLVAAGRTAIHRRVGIAGVVLTVVFVVVGYFTIIEQARRGFDLSGDLSGSVPPGAPPDPTPVALVAGNVLPFAILVGLGLWYRHRPDLHKRLILLGMVGGLTQTPVAHLIGHWALQPWAGVIVPVTSIVVLSLSAIYDRVSQGRIHPVSLWGATLAFVWQALFFTVIQPSSAWRDVAARLIQ